MSRFPAVFISHGSPELPLQSGSVVDFFKQLGTQLGQPKAILCISAHWGTLRPAVNGSLAPSTIHDFSGFSSNLYRLQYPAPADPELAVKVVNLPLIKED